MSILHYLTFICKGGVFFFGFFFVFCNVMSDAWSWVAKHIEIFIGLEIQSHIEETVNKIKIPRLTTLHFASPCPPTATLGFTSLATGAEKQSTTLCQTCTLCPAHGQPWVAYHT